MCRGALTAAHLPALWLVGRLLLVGGGEGGNALGDENELVLGQVTHGLDVEGLLQGLTVGLADAVQRADWRVGQLVQFLVRERLVEELVDVCHLDSFGIMRLL